MSIQNPAATGGTSCYCLTEAQEHRLYRARHTLNLLADLAAAAPLGAKILVDAESLEACLTQLVEMIPEGQELPPVNPPGEHP